MEVSMGPRQIRGQFTRPSREQLVLDVDAVSVEGGGRRIVKDATFWIPKGEFVCLCGPNGAGKSTLLKAILGLSPTSTGSIRILGEPPAKAHGKIGYLPQRKTFDRDFPARAVDLIVANLRGRWPLRVHKDERERACEVLDHVGGLALIDKPLATLSGGETQRVFLARALVTRPALLVLDEPTAGVDASGRAEFIELMHDLSRSDEIAAILVTHNLAAVARTAERIIYVESGRIIAWGLPAELLGHEQLTALAFQATDHASHARHALDEE